MDKVDRTALKVNQGFISGLLILGFVLSSTRTGPWLVAFVAAVMAIGTMVPSAGLFKLVYLKVLKPTGLLKPDPRFEDPVQHLFAQGMGAAVLGLALLLGWVSSSAIVLWALVWIVIALALVNLVFNFCAGCFIYTQLHLRRWLVAAEGEI